MKKLLIIIACVICVMSCQDATTSFVHTNERAKANVLVGVLYGHGPIVDNRYTTQGKQSPQWPDGLKIYEGYSCKLLAYDLVHQLEKHDIDSYLVNNDVYDIDLVERVERLNKMFSIDRRVVLISLHHNAQPTDRADYTDRYGQKGYLNTIGATGIEIYTTPGQTRSDTIATLIYNGIKKSLPLVNWRTDYKDGDPDKEAWFYVLKQTNCPAVLIEFGFMTTYSDCLLIANDSVRGKYIDGIVNGIIEYNKILKR